MSTANLPPASVLRPELRARLERLEHLERRERQNRYARWHVPAPAEREPEGWLLTYLDLITLLLVMLVVMLAFSQPKATLAEASTVATLEKAVAVPVRPEEGSGLQTNAGAAAHAPATQAAAPSPAPSGEAMTPPNPPLPVTADTSHELPTAAPTLETESAPASSMVPGMPGDPVSLPVHPAPVETLNAIAGEAGPALLADGQVPDSDERQSMHAADRPAPIDVALVGSVLSSQSLQSALPFSFDLDGTSTSSTAALPPDAAAAAMPADAEPEQARSLTDAPSTQPASADPSGKDSAQAAAQPPSIQDLGLDALGDNIDVIVNEESVSFRINNEILFTSGQADLMPSGLEVLTRLAEVLARNDYQIAVEGHTDPVPIQNDRFPSNWELSTGRATSVLRHLQSQGIPASRLRATGYADTRPIAPNDSQAGRAFNRRVELIMEMPRSARKTPQSSSSVSAATPLSLSGSDSAGPIVRLR